MSILYLYILQLRSCKLPCRHSPTCALSDLWNFKKVEKWNNTFETGQNFSLWRRRRNDTKVAEEFCWAITQAAGRSCCSRSGSCVLEFGFQLDSLVCTYIFDHTYAQLRLAPNRPERNYCVSLGGCVMRVLTSPCLSICSRVRTIEARTYLTKFDSEVSYWTLSTYSVFES